MPQPETDTTSRPTNVDIAAFPSNRDLSSPPPTPLVSSANMVSASSLESEESTDCSSSIDYEMELSSPSSFMPSSPEEMEISSPASPYPPAPTSALEWTTDELQAYMDCMLPLSSPRFSVPSEEMEISSSPPASPENPTPATKTPLTAMPTAQLQAFIDRIRDDKSADSSNPAINARWAVVSYILKHGISSPKKLDRSYVTVALLSPCTRRFANRARNPRTTTSSLLSAKPQLSKPKLCWRFLRLTRASVTCDTNIRLLSNS